MTLTEINEKIYFVLLSSYLKECKEHNSRALIHDFIEYCYLNKVYIDKVNFYETIRNNNHPLNSCFNAIIEKIFNFNKI